MFSDLAHRRGVQDRFDIDSCGTGDWHCGGPADPRSIAIGLKHGLAFEHCARQLTPVQDFQRFEFVIAMDRSNLRNIRAMGETHGVAPRELHLLRSFDPLLKGVDERELEVPDPYYGGPEGFQHMYDMIGRACDGLMDELLRRDAA